MYIVKRRFRISSDKVFEIGDTCPDSLIKTLNLYSCVEKLVNKSSKPLKDKDETKQT